MTERWHRIKTYILAQFQQASTWRGIVLMLTAMGALKNPQWGEAITALGLLIAGLIAVIFPDEVKK